MQFTGVYEYVAEVGRASEGCPWAGGEDIFNVRTGLQYNVGQTENGIFL